MSADYFREKARRERERVAALDPRERLKAFIIRQTYSHDMPYSLEGAFRDIPESEYPAVVDREIDAFKAEVLREAAEKIRSRGAAHLAFGRASWPFHEAADLIDPDKES